MRGRVLEQESNVTIMAATIKLHNYKSYPCVFRILCSRGSCNTAARGSQLFAKNFDVEFLFSSFFSLPLIFHLAGCQHFSFYHCHYKIFILLPAKFVSFALFLAPLLFLCYPCQCRHQKLVEKMTRFVVAFSF